MRPLQIIIISSCKSGAACRGKVLTSFFGLVSFPVARFPLATRKLGFSQKMTLFYDAPPPAAGLRYSCLRLRFADCGPATEIPDDLFFMGQIRLSAFSGGGVEAIV